MAFTIFFFFFGCQAFMYPKQKNKFNDRTISVPFCHICRRTHAQLNSYAMYTTGFFSLLFFLSIRLEHGRKQPTYISKIKLMILFSVLSTAISVAVVVMCIHSNFILFLFFFGNIHSGTQSLGVSFFISHAICKPKA